MNIFNKTLDLVKNEKNKRIQEQNFDLACSLRDVERRICDFQRRFPNYSITNFQEFMIEIRRNVYNYNYVKPFLKPLERKLKLDKINFTLAPLVRKDKIKKIEKLNKKT